MTIALEKSFLLICSNTHLNSQETIEEMLPYLPGLEGKAPEECLNGKLEKVGFLGESKDRVASIPVGSIHLHIKAD